MSLASSSSKKAFLQMQSLSEQTQSRRSRDVPSAGLTLEYVEQQHRCGDACLPI
jgi:hypothetical protein